MVVRPSETEPKLKVYISVSASNKDDAEKKQEELRAYISERIGL